MSDRFRSSHVASIAFVLLLIAGMQSNSSNLQACVQDESETTAAKTTQTDDVKTTPATQDESAADNLKSLKTQWAEFQGRLKSAAALIQKTENPDIRSELRNNYSKLITEANRMVVDIKHAAEKAFEDDATNQMAVKTMIGVMMNDATNGRDEEVLRTGDVLIAGGIDVSYFEMAATADRLSIDAREIFEELMIRQLEFKADNLPRVKLAFEAGDIILELFENEAPNTVANFISLVEAKFYDGLDMHRVMENFMAQGGRSPDENKPGYTIPCECYTPDARPHFTGSLSMAKTMERDSGGSEFFLTFSRTSMLDKKHTVFGRIISGIEVLDRITRTYSSNDQPLAGVKADVIKSAVVLRKRDHKYTPKKVGDVDESADDQPPTQPGKTGN